MATMECEIYDKEDEMVIVKSEGDIINKRKRLVYKRVNGRIVQEFV